MVRLFIAAADCARVLRLLMAWLLISALFLGGCTDEPPPEPAAELARQAAPGATESLPSLPPDDPQSAITPAPPAAEVPLTEPGVPAVELLPAVTPEMSALAEFAQ
ncbi:MAG: hypothetical protein CMK78_10255, partial [Pseudomonadales bacterium]|nr:hypothetical protein [Pseudomonadales bacterium]